MFTNVIYMSIFSLLNDNHNVYILVSIIIANIILIDCRTIVVTVPNKDEPNCVF
jgi:hypothetical protein